MTGSKSELIQSGVNRENINSAKKIYSPNQVACGAIGGPVGLIYFLYANFSSLQNEHMKKKTLIYGSGFIVALIAIILALPDDFPSTPFTVGYIVLGKLTAENFQMKKSDIIESSEYDFYSNWRVFGFSLLCLLASIVVIMTPIFIMAMLGMVE